MTDWTPWASGPPPRVGWFNASADRDPTMQRHFDGERWSAWCREDASEAEFATAQSQPDRLPLALIEWRDLSAETRRWLAAEGVEPTPCTER
jgi:hypothetical protein